MDQASREVFPDRAVPRRHWHPPDPVADILAAAWRPAAAEPREIRVRPELCQCILAELDPADRALVEEHGLLGSPLAIPPVVDAALPALPGIELARARPHAALA